MREHRDESQGDAAKKRHEAPETLHIQRRILEDVFDGSPSIIFLKDPDGHYITINKTFEKLLGIPREQLNGKTDHDIFPKDQAEDYRAHDKEVLKTGKAIQFEEIANFQGQQHVFLANKFPIFDASGSIYAVCGISHDVTERKQSEEAVKRNELLNAAIRLTGSIAHELNNPLQVVTSVLDLLAFEEALSERGREHLRLAQEHLLQAAKLAKRVLETEQQLFPNS